MERNQINTPEVPTGILDFKLPTEINVEDAFEQAKPFTNKAIGRKAVDAAGVELSSDAGWHDFSDPKYIPDDFKS